MFSTLRRLALATALVVVPATALAGSVTLDFSRASLTNVSDAAGIWQMEGGQLFMNGNAIGDYAVTRRTVTGGTTAQNTAMLTMTLFIAGQHPPKNVTIQGAHDYSSGGFVGSVSAASDDLSFLIGADVVGNTASDTLTLTW